MAQGGQLKDTRKGRVFTQGRLKGMTQDQAVQYGRNLWAGASDWVKDKYAERSNMQSPSERSRADAGGKRPSPQEARMKFYKDQKDSRMQQYQGGGGASYSGPGARNPTEGTLLDRATASNSSSTPSIFADLTTPSPLDSRVPSDRILAIGDNSTPEEGSLVGTVITSGTPPVRSLAVGGSTGMPRPAGNESWITTDEQKEKTAQDLGLGPELAKKKEAEAEAAKAKAAKDKADKDKADIDRARANVGLPVTPFSDLPTDERMHAENKTNKGGVPVVKQPPGPREKVTAAPATPSSPAPAPAPAPKLPRFSEQKAPEGQEAIGVRNGKLIYAPVSDVYEGQNLQEKVVNPNATAPESNRIVAPVTLNQNKSIEKIRADYQTRASTPQQYAGAQRMMEQDGNSPMARQPSFQGPQTQRQIDESRGIRLPKTQQEKDTEARNIRLKQDPDIFKKDDEAYAAYQASLGNDEMSDGERESLKNANKLIFDRASPMDQARLPGNSMRRAQAQINAATDTSGAPRATPVRQPDRMSNIASPTPAASASRFRAPIGRRLR